MAFDFSNITDEELEAMAAQSAPASEPMPQKPLSEWTDEELEAYASEPTPAPAQPAAHSPRMTREERIAANNRAIETARSQEDPGFLSAAGDALAEGAKGAARAVKSIGSGIVGMASGAVRLAGTPVRLATGWEGLHRLADTIDSSYENFGADALMSDYGENPDGFGFAAGRFGEKLAGTAGSLAALGGVGKAVGAAGTALKAAGHAKTAAAVANTLPLMFGNDAAVRAYDTARANGKSKGESAALAGLNGAIHFLGFKAFENKALNKMLGMPAEMEGLMPKWAGEAAEAGEQSFSSLARGVRNGMIKYTLAERGKGALKAGGIMGLQDMLSDPVMQVAEGASIDDIDFSRMLKAGASGLGEGALMEGALGAASVLKSPSEARKFIADKIFRGKDYKVMGSDGKMHDEPGLLNTSEGRMVLMKQNPDATERVLDIVEHGGTPRPAELDAAFLPPDMTAEELKKFASDWRNDLKPYVDEAWAADAPRQTSAPDAAAAEPGRDMLSPEEAQSQQKVADRRAAADSMMLDFESWNRLYADGKTDLNFDEWRAAGKPGVIEANLTPKTEEAPTSETRANEEPAQPAPERPTSVGKAESEAAKPVESAEARAEAPDAGVVAQPAVWPNGWDNAGEEIKGYVVPNDSDVAQGREVAIAHRSGGSINAPQKIKGVVESVDGDKVKVYYRDGMGYDQHDTFKKSELVGVMPLTAVPTEGATPQTAQNRIEATQEGAGAQGGAAAGEGTPAPAKPVEAASRVSGAKPIPDGKGKMVKPKAAESDYGVTMFEEPSVDGDGVRYVVKDGPSDAHRMMFKSKAEAEARLGELRAERKAIQESPSATLSDGKKVRLLKTDEGWVPYDENYNDLRHGMFNAAKTKAEAVKVAEKGVKWARDVAEENARLKAESAKSKPDGKGKMVKPADAAKPVSETPKTEASVTAPVQSGNAAPVVENRGDAATVAAPESVEAKIAAMKRGSPEQLKAQREYVEREVAKAKDAIKGKFRPKAGRLSPREKAVDAYERVKNTGDIPETVNIKVPGDGEITVKNNPNGMAFLDRFVAKFRPHPTSGESAMALPRSPSIKVADKPKAESAEKEFAPFVSKDKTRERMLKPYTEGKMVVATDGRVAIRRPLRKGESVKGADDAPRTVQIFGSAEDAATESAAIDVQAIFPKLQQALALEGSLFVESYEPETGKPTGLIPRATSHAVELWRDAGGALQVRSRDTDGNSYASDAWSGDSAPVAAFDGKALVEIVRLAAKNGEGKIEVRFAKDAQNNPVLFSFGGYEAALMPLRAKGHFDEARRVDGENARANPAMSAEGVEAASRASDAQGAGAQPPSVPAEPPAKPKSNRLRRADGTDPLAEKPTPKTLQKAVDKISSAIVNRTGTGVITPDEAYGIVKGIAESPRTKHNRTRDFFDPLENDAAWHESMGLDAESAKNIRDAFDRVKADADLKKWFPQVDSAVKKANDGRLSKKDAAPLFGKISEGLEKAERMGLSETANRLREAAEVIRPVAETVEQGDVNKFNYSMKGRKLNNRLGGTDKRGGKTVSLDTKNGTVDVRADDKGSTLGGNRHLIIDGVKGDELTVTMKDAAGKTIATRKMNRAQWSALSQGAVATDGDPANPQKGDLIRMSRSDATDAPQSWTPEAQKPLERVAHALRNVVTVGGKKVKVEFLNERPESDGPNAFKNSDGVTVGDYAKGEIRLYPGATVADVVHEFTHPLVDFARAEANAGRSELLDKINQIIDAERATWEQPVREAYKDKSNETILEEIFTHAMGEKGADLFGKSTKTLQGRRWYNRLWEAIKGVWQDFATKMGWNKADLHGLERMSPEDAAQKILSEMAKGRNFGDAVTGGEGTAEARRIVPPKPSAPPPKIDMSKDESLKEKYLRNMSDRYDPLKRLVEEAKESAAKPSDVPDPYYEKRVQSGHNEADRHQIDILKNKYVDFLKRHSHGQKEQEKLHEEVNMYLRARDALYRNRIIAERKAEEADKATWRKAREEALKGNTAPLDALRKAVVVDPSSNDYSGISTDQAHKILDDFKRRMRTPILDQAFKIMQEVKKTYGLQRLVDGGMLDQATATLLEKRNPDYAPQRTSRLDEEGIDRNSTRNMEAAAIKKALGRSTLSDNPVEFLFLQASDAAARTNENRTRQEMAKFVRMFPEVGKVRTVDKTSAYDLKTGKDAWIEDPHDVESENPLVVSFRENGKRMRIEFADTPRGRLLAESMRNEGVNRGPEAFNRMTRAWASTATQLSATFSGRNFQKDTVEVALNSAADTGFSGAGKFLKAQIAQMKPVVSTIREYLTKGTFGGPLGKEFKEFIDAGGSIGGMGREGYEDLKDTFSRKAKGLKMAFSGAHGVKEKVEAILGVTFGKIEDFNKTIEMMSRFNNYRSRRAKGESEKEAVIGSREDSTDFNMYGQQRWLNDVYMFSNSILGGTLRSTKQLATGKNGLKVATAVLAYGFVEAAADVLRNWGDDDEAEKSGLGGAKDLSERERSQTLYFRYGGKYFRIPVHGGPFSALKYTGGLIARAALGKLSWSDAAKNAGKEWATIGTHFGGAGEIDLTNGPKGIVSSFTPSVARPVAELGMNQDFAGRHIYAPEGFDRTTPKSERGFKSTGDGYKWFARLMNKVGGGNESRSADWSWFDNPPEAYKHIVEAVGKNMVRDIMLGGETAGRAVESAVNWENRFTRDDVPFLRDVTRNVPDNSRRYYNALEDYERDKAEFKKTTPERRREMKSEKPYLFVGKSLLDGQIEQVKKYMHLERGEVKVGQKWVEPKTPRTEEQKEKYRKLRLEMQARVLKRLGE